MRYEIVIARHGSPLYRVSADTVEGIEEESARAVENMKAQGEPVTDLGCIWETFPDEEYDDILMTFFPWERIW